MISVIIPVYNEEGVIGNTVRYLKTVSESEHIKEIIVVDGGSCDNSVAEAEKEGALVIRNTRKGRATQMNEGARVAKGSILYFLHADSIPPGCFATDITEAVKNGFPVGCYRLRFDLDHWFLKVNTWFTRFDINAFRYGDQSLFVTKEIFFKASGFSEKHVVMEDHEIIRRLRRHGNFIIVPKEIITSARKYVANGVFKMQGVFYLMYFMYRLGWSQEKLVAIFGKLVRQNKL
jgi:rSAM/selenodomain-associated transferase 2